jgi:hypothetical protein
MLMADDSRAIRLNLTPEEWRQLRIRAAEQELSMTQLATVVIREYLQRKRGVKKPAP